MSEVSTEALVGLPVWEAASSDGCCCCLCAASPSHSMVGWGLSRAALCLGGNGSLDSPLCCQLSGTAAWNSLEEWRPGGSDCWAVLIMMCAEITARLGFSLHSWAKSVVSANVALVLIYVNCLQLGKSIVEEPGIQTSWALHRLLLSFC